MTNRSFRPNRSTRASAFPALLCATALATAWSAPASAQVAPADGATQTYQAPNGATVVNIATPNGAGVSMNRYDQYNVSDKGLVLNNGGPDALTRQSQLAGSVSANANITGPGAALIVNQVVKANPTTLAGYTEVLGSKADVVVANPWGVTCDGCGFINTGQLALTTGIPQFAADGRFTGLRASDGVLTITGKGLDASAADMLTLVARSIKVDGQVNAKALDLVGGVNSYDWATRTATALSGGTAPEYAIDVSALGSLYGGRIRLIVTEAGVGVRALGNVAATGGDLSIDASGAIVLGSGLTATGALSASSATAGIIATGARIASGTTLRLDATRGTLTLGGGSLIAGTDLTVNTLALSDTGRTGDANTRDAVGTSTLTIGQAGAVTGTQWRANTSVDLTAGSLLFHTGALSADSVTAKALAGDMRFEEGAGIVGKTITAMAAGTLSTTQTSYLRSQGALSIGAQWTDTAGRLSATGALGLTGALSNSGTIVGLDRITIASGTGALANSGTIAASGPVQLAAATLTSSGTIASDGAITADLGRSAALSGKVSAGGALMLRGTTAPIAVTISGVVQSAGHVSLTGAIGDVSVSSAGQLLGNTLALSGTTILNDGLIQADHGATLNAAALDNRGTFTAALDDGVASTLTLGSLVNVGTLRSKGSFDLRVAGALGTTGAIVGTGVSITSGGTTTIGPGGTLSASGAVAITARDALTVAETGQLLGSTIDIAARGIDLRGLVQSDAAATLDSGTLAFANSGTVRAAADLTLLAGSTFDNSGAIVSGGTWRLRGTATAAHNAGLIQAKTLSIGLSGLTLTNVGTGTGGGDILANTIDVSIKDLVNSGYIQATNDSTVMLGGDFTNSGILNGLAALNLGVAGTTINSASIQAQRGLTFTGATLINSGLINVATSTGLTGTLTFGRVDNQAGGTIQSVGNLSVNWGTGGIVSSGRIIASQGLTMRGSTGGPAVRLDGRIQARSGALLIDTAGADLTLGAPAVAVGDTTTILARALTNAGYVQSSQGMTIGTTAGLTNSGTLSAIGARGNFALGTTLSNSGTIQTFAGLDLTADALDNQGLLIASDDAGATASLRVGSVTNGAGARIQGSGDLSFALGRNIANAGIVYGTGGITFTGGSAGASFGITNSSGSIVQAGGLLKIDSPSMDLAIGAGSRWYGGTVDLKLRSLDLGGLLQSGGTLGLMLVNDLRDSGILYAGGQGTIVAGSTVTNSGTIQADGLTLTAPTVSNAGGLIFGANATKLTQITANSVTNVAAAAVNGVTPASGIQSRGSIALTLNGTLDNRGAVLSGQDITINGPLAQISNTATGVIDATGTLAVNTAGSSFTTQAGMLAGGKLLLSLPSLSNSGTILGRSGGNTLAIAGTLTNAADGAIYLSTASDVARSTIAAQTFDNGGLVQASSELAMTTRGVLTNRLGSSILGGASLAFGNVAGYAGTLNNLGLIQASGQLSFVDAGATPSYTIGNAVKMIGSTITTPNGILALNNYGEIYSLHAMNITAGSISNLLSSSKIFAAVGDDAGPADTSLLKISNAANSLDNFGAIYGGGGGLTVNAFNITNEAGGGMSSSASGKLTLTADNFVTNYGAIFGATLFVNAWQFSNYAGASVDLSTNGVFNIRDTFYNEAEITSNNNLTITAPRFKNDAGSVSIADDNGGFNPNWCGSDSTNPNCTKIGFDWNTSNLILLGTDSNNTTGRIINNTQRHSFNHTTSKDDDNDFNTTTFAITQRYTSPKPTLKPSIIANGTLAISGFISGLNRGGVISADTINLRGIGSSSTFTQDALAIYRQNWQVTWLDFHECTSLGSCEDWVRFLDYNAHTTSVDLIDSVGASISARILTGNNFGLVNTGTTQNGAVSTTNVAAQPLVPITPAPAPSAAMSAVALGSVPIGAVATSLINPSITFLGTVDAMGAVGTGTTTTSAAVTSAISGSTTTIANVVAANAASGVAGTTGGVNFGSVTIQLPTSANGAFIPAADPKSTYLIETNPLYTTGDAVGLDLLASKLGLDPTGLIRRLGDAAYEDYLIREQIVAQTGTNLLIRGITQASQTKALISSAADQAGKLGLVYGQAPTAEQQSKLTSDIVWMVATKVGNETVLSPVVYLSAATKNAFDKGEATIAANYANLALSSFVNDGGTVKANVLVLDVAGNIANNGGRIAGGTVVLRAGGDITNTTYSKVSTDNVYNTFTQVGAVSAISATDTLMLQAGGDISNTAGTMNSGGDLLLIAGKSVTFDTIADQKKSGDKWYNVASTTTIGSTLGARGDLYVEAGEDIAIKGSTVKAGGVAAMVAGNDVTIASATDKTEEQRMEYNGGLVSSSYTTSTRKTETSVGSTVDAGSLYTQSGRDTTIKGSTVTAKGDAVLQAGRDLTVIADTNIDRTDVKTETSGMGVGDALYGIRTKTVEDEAGRNVSANIKAGGDVTAIAQGDVSVVGSKLAAGGTLGVKGANVDVLAGKDYDYHKETTTLTTVLGVSAGGSASANAAASGEAWAGGNHVGGSAGAGASASAQVGGGNGAQTSTAASADASKGYDNRETVQETERAQTGGSSVGVSGKASAGAEANANAGLTLVGTKTTTTTDYASRNVASALSAGKDTVIVADKDLRIAGSSIAAGRDATLGATNIAIEAGENTTYHSTESSSTQIGAILTSRNSATATAEVQGTTGTTGSLNAAGAKPTSSGGGAGGGANAGQTGGALSASVTVAASSNNNLDQFNNSQSADSRATSTSVGSSIAAGGVLTMVAKDNLKVAGSDLSGDAGVQVKAKNMQFLAAQDTADTASSSRTTATGLYLDVGGVTTAGAGGGADSESKGGQSGATANASAAAGVGREIRNEMTSTGTASSAARVSTITSSAGNVVRVADGNITDNGTQIIASKDVLQQSQTFDSLAARSTSTASAATFVDRVRMGAYADAGAGTGADASAQGRAGTQDATASGSGSAGAGAGVDASLMHRDEQSGASANNATVSTIASGGRTTIVTSGKTTLEGTQLASGGDLTIAAGSLDFKAAESTKTDSNLANSADIVGKIGVDAQKYGQGYAELGYTGSGGEETTRTTQAGRATAGGKLTIVSQGATNLEGTNLASGSDMTVYSKGDLNFGTARDSVESTNHEQTLAGSISFAGQRGENAAAKAGVSVDIVNERAEKAGSATSGGKLTIVSDGNASFDGTKLAANGTATVVAAKDLTFGTAATTVDDYSASASLGGGTSRASSATTAKPIAQASGATSGTAARGASTAATTAGATPAPATTTAAGAAAPASGWTSASRSGTTVGSTAAANAQANTQVASASTSTIADLKSRSNASQQGGFEAGASFQMEQSTTREAASVSSKNGDVVLKSGGDMTLQGTDIAAGKGTVVLDSGKSINFDTADSKALKIDVEAGMVASRGRAGGVGTNVTDVGVFRSTDGSGAADVNATGAATNTTSGAEVLGATGGAPAVATTTASTTTAGGTGTAAAGTAPAGGTTTTAAASSTPPVVARGLERSGGLSADASGSYVQSEKAGSITAQNVVTRSAGDTTFRGTDINVSKDASITAGGDVNFTAAQSFSADASVGVQLSGSKAGAVQTPKTTPAPTTAARPAATPSRTNAATPATAATPDSATPSASGAGVATTATPTTPPSIGSNRAPTTPATPTTAPAPAPATAAATTTTPPVAQPAAKPKDDADGLKTSGGLTDIGAGVQVTNKGSTVDVGGNLTINSGGKVTLEGTTGDVGGKTQINAVDGVTRETIGSAGAEIGMTRVGANAAVQEADLGTNAASSKQTGDAARAAVTQALAAPTPGGTPVPPALQTSVTLPAMPEGQKPVILTSDGKPAPSWVTIDPKTGVFSGSPPADFTGSLSFVLAVPLAKGGVQNIPVNLNK